MFYRIAKISDLYSIVKIHYCTRDVNDNGIFARMGKPFFNEFYKIVINNKYTICVCAEDNKREIQGFIFIVLDSKKFDQEILAKRINLIFGATLSVIFRPSLLIPLMKRYKSLKKQNNNFVHNEGVRGGFWGWDPDSKDSISSYELHERALLLIKSLGIKELFFEVDKENKNTYKFHKMNGAQELEVMILDDNRNRSMMKYDLLTHKFRIL